MNNRFILDKLTRREQLELVAQMLGYTLTWSDDGRDCWTAEVRALEMNSDDPWAPDRIFDHSFRLMFELDMHYNFAYRGGNDTTPHPLCIRVFPKDLGREFILRVPSGCENKQQAKAAAFVDGVWEAAVCLAHVRANLPVDGDA